MPLNELGSYILILPLILGLVLLSFKKFPNRFFFAIYLVLSIAYISIAWLFLGQYLPVLNILISPVLGILVFLVTIGFVGTRKDYSFGQTLAILVGFFPIFWSQQSIAVCFIFTLVAFFVIDSKLARNKRGLKNIDFSNLYAPLGIISVILAIAVEIIVSL